MYHNHDKLRWRITLFCYSLTFYPRTKTLMSALDFLAFDKSGKIQCICHCRIRVTVDLYTRCLLVWENRPVQGRQGTRHSRDDWGL